MTSTTRMRISEEGPQIAKSGFDVDTASIANMVFSPSLVALRVALTGTVSVSSFSGLLSSRYLKGTVTFPTSFARPPIVMVAAILDDGTTQQGLWAEYSISGGTALVMPTYQIDTYTDHFDLFAYKSDGSFDWLPLSDTWRYWVFQNTLDT